MPDFELSPRDLAAIAQLEEASIPAEQPFRYVQASNLYGDLPLEERPPPNQRLVKFNRYSAEPEFASAWPGTTVGRSAPSYRLHMPSPRADEHFRARGADPMRPRSYDPRAASLRYESLLSDLAPFMDEARRNQQALEAIPFVAR